MYRYVNFYVNSILLNITLPPGPEATPTTTNVTERGIIMKIISMENKKRKRSKINNNLYYNFMLTSKIYCIGSKTLYFVNFAVFPWKHNSNKRL